MRAAPAAVWLATRNNCAPRSAARRSALYDNAVDFARGLKPGATISAKQLQQTCSSSAAAAEQMLQASRQHRTWEFKIGDAPWTAFGKPNGSALDDMLRQGRSYGYLRIDADKLSAPVKNCNIIHKATSLSLIHI